MRPARAIAPIVAPVLGLSLLTGCGSADTASPTPATASTFSCPTDNTQTFPKARFVLNMGLAVGATNQWVLKPWKAGTFASGADGRTAAIVKAGLATAFAGKQVKDAIDNVKADPTMCNAIGAPLSQLGTALDGITDKIKNGDLGSLTSLEGLIGTVMSDSKKAGVEIVEQTPSSL